MALTANLENLPLEVLINICEAIDTAHRPSIASFSLTNRQCCRAASVLKYRRIRLRANCPQQLSDTTLRWTHAIAAVDGFAHVRHLHIEIVEQDGKGNDSKDAWQQAWEALALLVDRMRSLVNLVYDSSLLFPARLLDVLGAKGRSLCRLHIQKFELPSLVGPAYDNGIGDFELTPDELLLAVSPNLHAINVQLGSPYGHNDRDFNLLAVQQLVRGGNTNIKAVEVHRNHRPKAISTRRPLPDEALRTWRGFSVDRPRRGLLHSLKLSEYGGVTLQRFGSWYDCTELAVLRTLKLCRGVDVSVLRWVVERSPSRDSIFPLLSCLELEAGRTETAQEVASATQAFLRCLPPLEDLTLSGGFGDPSDDMTKATMAAVLESHGTSLLRLSLPQTRYSPPVLASSIDAYDLVTDCPELQYLNISIARSGGDAEEVAIYQQLGSHPRLQNLCLTLDCTEYTLKTHLQDPFDKMSWNGNQRLCNGHIRKSLTNCALDGALATAIFQQVTNAKTSAATSLKRLEIKTSNAGKFRSSQTVEINDWGTPMDPRTLHPIFNHLGGKVWSVTPHPSDARPGEVVVQGTDAVAAKEPIVLGEMELLFRTLWPKGASGDCRDDWHSFPLAG